jgi:hypothetical protein
MTGITLDTSYNMILSSESKVGVDVTKPLLEVDTGIWYVNYKGTWYPQNTSPL